MPIRRLLLAALCVAALVPSARAADLDVTVTGVTADSGDIRVIVITDPDGLARQDRSLNLKAASAKDGVIITRFLGLSPGRYGVVATHDSHVNHALEKAVTGTVAANGGVTNEARVVVAEPATPVTLSLH